MPISLVLGPAAWAMLLLGIFALGAKADVEELAQPQPYLINEFLAHCRGLLSCERIGHAGLAITV